ncbi:MAG: molybdenum cofactor guanylyltransferase [Clostridia bacterium]|nr:molybdenum cofactor guanylyltransferase [Clostridia bacterium]MBQ9309017.1 molybdenum cofactor guanylyltransferase [Clostridia bacterium]
MLRYIDTQVQWNGQMCIRRHYADPADWRADRTRLAEWICGIAPGLLLLRPDVPEFVPSQTDAASASTTLILLAGGKSRRMGTDKALLPFYGTSLMHFQMEKASLLGARLLISAGENPERLRSQLSPGRESSLVSDEIPDRGPLSGLAACLKLAQTPRCLVLPVDAPFVPAKAFCDLLSAPETSPIVQLSHHGRIEYLLGRWDAALWQKIEESIQTKAVSVHAFSAQTGAATCPSDLDDTFFVNLNHPSDYEAILHAENR